MIFDDFTILKPICIIVLNMYMYYERNTGGLWRCQRSFRPARDIFLKESDYPQMVFMRCTFIMLHKLYIFLLIVFDSLVTQPGRISFAHSFIERMVLLIPSFFLLFKLNVAHLSHVVVVTSPSCFLMGD